MKEITIDDLKHLNNVFKITRRIDDDDDRNRNKKFKN